MKRIKAVLAVSIPILVVAISVCIARCSHLDVGSLMGKTRKEVYEEVYRYWVSEWRPTDRFTVDLYIHGDGQDPRRVNSRHRFAIKHDAPNADVYAHDAECEHGEKCGEAYCWQFFILSHEDLLGRSLVPTVWFDDNGIVTNCEEVLYISK